VHFYCNVFTCGQLIAALDERGGIALHGAVAEVAAGVGARVLYAEAADVRLASGEVAGAVVTAALDADAAAAGFRAGGETRQVVLQHAAADRIAARGAVAVAGQGEGAVAVAAGAGDAVAERHAIHGRAQKNNGSGNKWQFIIP
jgi:hypothetical protein